jgi:hypothetical protein
MINVIHNDDDTGLEVRVDLAGASKDSVDLDAVIKVFALKLKPRIFDMKIAICLLMRLWVRKRRQNLILDY